VVHPEANNTALKTTTNQTIDIRSKEAFILCSSKMISFAVIFYNYTNYPDFCHQQGDLFLSPPSAS